MDYKQLHEKAMECARRYIKAEGELLEILQEIDKKRFYRNLGYASTFSYAVNTLKLSEAQAYNFINVARKALEVPELKTAVVEGTLTVSKARKIVPVLTPHNQSDWIACAAQLPQREVERIVALQAVPTTAHREITKIVSGGKTELKFYINERIDKMLQRSREIMAKKSPQFPDLEATLETLLMNYLSKKDAVERAKRNAPRDEIANLKSTANPFKNGKPVARQVRQAIPAQTRHAVILRDGGQCTAIEPHGKRCQHRTWVDLHHIRPVSQRGENSAENLTTLCRSHHRGLHEGLETKKRH